MMKLNRMVSIGQFRDVIKNVQHATWYVGQDDDGEPIYDNTVKLPVINAKGTVKIHGTNAGLSFHKDEMWTQSKKNIITPEKDNAGFAFFVKTKEMVFKHLIDVVRTTHGINTDENTITIMGEWAGKGIQGGVAVSNLDKKFYIFGIKIKPVDEEIPSYWVEHDIFPYEFINGNDIYNVNQFKQFFITIDFENPENPLMSQKQMVDWVMEVERECPVGKFFNVVGYGEGIVFTFEYKGNRYIFKCKGDKHAGKPKVKKAKKVDDVKLQLINDIVEQITPEWRLSQAFDEVFDVINGGVGDIKRTGDFLRAVHQDIIKEESDIIAEAGLIPKDINGRVSKVAREWFMLKLDEESGLV